MNELIILLLIIPLAGAFLSALGKYIRRFPLAEISSLLAVVLCLGLLAFLYPAATRQAGPVRYELGGWPEPVGISIYLDGLAWISSLVGMIVALSALLFAVWEKRYRPGFYFFFLLLVFGMEGVILTGDLFNMFVFLEIMSIASYILIVDSGKRDSLVASFRYLMISSLGMAFFLLGIYIFYQAAGTLSLRSLAVAAREIAARGAAAGNAGVGNTGISSRGLNLAIVCLVVGAGVKAAFIPFHTWLPSAHATAPHPVSAILSGVMIKVSFLVVWRLLRLFDAQELQSVLLWVGSATALYGVVGAISQTDSKRLLAYHSVSQMGYIVASFGAGTSLALAASLYHLVNHSLFKSLLFLSIGTVISATGERNIRRLGNLGGKMLPVFLTFLVGAFSIAGLPPFNGYISKSLILDGLEGRPLAFGLIFLAGAGTVASFLKLSGIFVGKKAFPPIGEPARELRPPIPPTLRPTLHPMVHAPLFLLSLLCLATGVFPGFFQNAFYRLLWVGEGDPAQAPVPVGNQTAFYSPSHLLLFAATMAAGVLAYLLLVRTERGNRILERLRSVSPDLNAALVLVIAGFLVLVLLVWLL